MPLSQLPLQEQADLARIRAARTSSGLPYRDLTRLRREMQRLNSDEARGAYADEWVRIAATSFERSWPEFYAMLAQVRDKGLYRDQYSMKGGQTYETFEDYFEAVAKQSYATFFELERTYKFVSQTAPELLSETYEVAKTAALGHRGRPTNEEREDKGYNVTLIPRGHNREYAVARLERDAQADPTKAELLAEVKAGRKSAHAAAVEAGYVRRHFSVPADPERAAMALSRHFTPDELRALVSALAAMIDFRV